MNRDISKKTLLAQYKEREVVGGICAIKNMASGKMLLEASTDVQGSKNRFEFAQKTGSCVSMKLQNDWNRQGGEQFVFEVLEEHKKRDTQTDKEFKADIDLLMEMWLEKLAGAELY